MRVKVARFTDINPANIIIEPLLTTEPALIERGRNELDEHQFSRNIYSFTAPFNDNLTPGQMIEISDSTINEAWRGKILSVSIQLSSEKISTSLKVERIIQ